ncbi:MAG: hypothetical protein QXF45_05840 [Candidatus Caldarchaeum sp.]
MFCGLPSGVITEPIVMAWQGSMKDASYLSPIAFPTRTAIAGPSNATVSLTKKAAINPKTRDEPTTINLVLLKYD